MANNEALLSFLKKYHSTVGGNGLPWYGPQRDLTNLGVIVIEEMYEDLIRDDHPKLVKDWMEAFSVSKEEALEGYAAFLRMAKCMLGETRQETVAEAAQASGYDEVPMKVKGLIDSLFGRAMMAAYWYTVRDVTDSVTKEMPPWINYHKLDNLFQEAMNSLEGDESKRGRKYIEVRDE